MSSSNRIAPFPLSTNAKVMTYLQAAESTNKKRSFAEAWAEPELFDKYGLAYFKSDLLESALELQLPYLEKLVRCTPLLIKILNKQEDLQFLLNHPEINRFFPAIHPILSEEPLLLTKVLNELGLRVYIELVGGIYREEGLAKEVMGLFLKQTPENKLRILLSTRVGWQRKQADDVVEDDILNEPMRLAEAFYLRMDLPPGISEEPKLYKRETLDKLSKSPFSRKSFGANDRKPMLAWMNASAAQRFVMAVQAGLDTKYANVSEYDILMLIQKSFLQTYVKANPYYRLVQRLELFYPWESEPVPERVDLLRKELGKAYFFSAKERTYSYEALESQMSFVNALKPVEPAKEEEVKRDCYSSFSCYKSGR